MGYSFDQNDLKKNYVWKSGIMTGDIGKIDEENFLYITGRKKRFAKLYGISVSLDEIENLLKSKFSVSDFAVISKLNKILIYTSILKLKEKIKSNKNKIS